MKKLRLHFLAVVSVAALILSGCGGADKMKELPQGTNFTLTPNPLEVHGNKVKGTIEGTFPAKYFNKKATLEITPVIVFEGGELALPVKVLQGQDVEANNQVISYDAGGSFKQEFEFDYKDEMLKSDVELRMVITYKDKKIPFDVPQKIGAGVIATSKLVNIDPKPVMMKDNFQRVITENKEAQINFVIQRSDIRRSELTKEEVKMMESFIAEVVKVENKELKGVAVSAYASPDGPENLNDKLSKERGKNTENWLGGVFKKAKVEGKAADYVSAEVITEDWDGFKKMVEASSIEDKELILRVLSMYSDPVVREREIKNLSKVYLVLAEKILPELRRSKMIAKVDKIGLSDEQLVEAVNTKAYDKLNVEEMLFAATLITDDAKKIEVYNKAGEMFNCARGYNNAAALYIKANDLSAAKAALDKADAAKANIPAVINNRGCVALMEGNLEEAEGLFTRAADAGPEVKYNLGIISIVKGLYPAAVEYLGGSDSFNQGLALLLAGKTDAAKNTFQKVDHAKASYGLAIIGARMQDETLLLNSLRTAIGKDASLKERALKDMEFRNYLTNAAFKAIVE